MVFKSGYVTCPLMISHGTLSHRHRDMLSEYFVREFRRDRKRREPGAAVRFVVRQRRSEMFLTAPTGCGISEPPAWGAGVFVPSPIWRQRNERFSIPVLTEHALGSPKPFPSTVTVTLPVSGFVTGLSLNGAALQTPVKMPLTESPFRVRCPSKELR